MGDGGLVRLDGPDALLLPALSGDDVPLSENVDWASCRRNGVDEAFGFSAVAAASATCRVFSQTAKLSFVTSAWRLTVSAISSRRRETSLPNGTKASSWTSFGTFSM